MNGKAKRNPPPPKRGTFPVIRDDLYQGYVIDHIQMHATYTSPNTAYGALQKQHQHELALAKANEKDVQQRLEKQTRVLQNLRETVAAIHSVLPWRDVTAAMALSDAEAFGALVVTYWISKGVRYPEAARRADLWWQCPTCKDDINADEDSGPHEYCEFADYTT